jgi:hypothetical protein
MREMLAVLSVLRHAMVDQNRQREKILMYTDNTNTVDAFNSLHADPSHNTILIQAVDLQVETLCQVRVLYIEGSQIA